jgi:hypothetical protein
MKNKIDVFVPPGVQMKLSARLGRIPRQATPAVAAKIEKLWSVRNNCAESEIESLDQKMEEIMVAHVRATLMRTPRVIWENRNLHGTGDKRCKVFVMPVKSLRDSWRNVTDVRCPACHAGIIRWHEAGYVPGYRICDGCGRTFLAKINFADGGKLTKLILDTRNI